MISGRRWSFPTEPKKISEHTAEAIRFLHRNAERFNIDPKRISVMGSSAGALISGYLGHGTRLPIRSVFAHQQPMGTPELILPVLRRDGPPIVLFTTSGPNDRIHHPDHARVVHDRCKKLGVVCRMYGSKKSGLPTVPAGEDIHDKVMAFFYKSWKPPHADRAEAPEPLKRKPNSQNSTTASKHP